MKKVWLVALFCLALAAGASAQVPMPFSIYAGGLISVPSAPEGFKQSFKNGWHGSVGLGFNMSPAFQVIGKVELHSFAIDWKSSDFAAYEGVEGGTNKVWMYGADLRFAPNLPAAPLHPFVLGGVGLASMQQTDFSGTNTLATSQLNGLIPDNQSKLYYNFGGGVEMKMGPAFNLFAQVRYVSIQTDGESSAFIPLTLGLKFF